MAQTTDNCEILRNEILEKLDSVKKEFDSTKLDKDMEYLIKFENEFQVKAYSHKVKRDWIIYVMKNVSKLVALISSIAGTITAVVEIFII
jgi:hypothetical protein